MLVRGNDLREGKPFARPGSDRVVCSLDTLAGIDVRRPAADVEPYDLAVFDERNASARQGPT
jgi:hypothetical protein